jgi:hypothetical protein
MNKGGMIIGLESMLENMGCENVTTSRQEKNGTSVWLAPNGYKMAEYKSGYIRVHYKGNMWPINPRNPRGSWKDGKISCKMLLPRSTRLAIMALFIRKTLSRPKKKKVKEFVFPTDLDTLQSKSAYYKKRMDEAKFAIHRLLEANVRVPMFIIEKYNELTYKI